MQVQEYSIHGKKPLVFISGNGEKGNQIFHGRM
jgi:hypothetical protein